MLIITNKSGRLGNRLFLFSRFIGYAIDKKIKILNPSFDEYCDFFENLENNIIPTYPLLPKKKKKVFLKKFKRKILFYLIFGFVRIIQKLKLNALMFFTIIESIWDKSKDLNSDEITRILTKKSVTFIIGFKYSNKKAFITHANEIRKYFLPLEKYREEINKFIMPIKQKNYTIVGVHIRREDYRTWKNGKYYYSIEQFVRIMKKIEKIFIEKSIYFIICSNEKLEKKDFDCFNFSFGIGHVLTDLYTFASCDYIVGPPSTFTLWGSFYGEVPIYFIEDANQHINKNSFVKAVETKYI